MNKKEFDRSVCFQFYKSYLEQGEQVKEQLGAEMCAEYFIALVRYGLYQEESNNPMIKMLIAGLKNTIDAGQEKRAKCFNGEDTELTTKIIEYKNANPDASQRNIADACGCSVGKVNKVLNSNNNLNNNSNSNSNSNSNNNSVNVNVNTTEEEEKRGLEDLTEEELESISDDYRKKVKYIETKNRLNLNCEVNKDTHVHAMNIVNKRKAEKEREEREKVIEQLGFSLDDDITLDMAFEYATKVLNFSVTKEDMQEDYNIHVENNCPYTWTDFVNPKNIISRDNFYDYTAAIACK